MDIETPMKHPNHALLPLTLALAALVVGLSLSQPAKAGVWSTTGSLNTGRLKHTATVLPNGQVLVVGGYSGRNSDYWNSAELYDPATGTWATTGSLLAARGYGSHTATLLPNGKVLVVGGDTGGYYTADAELYDPASGTWAMTGSLNAARRYHTATLLANGKVLVVGGSGSGGWLNSAELYDPASGTWTTTGSLKTPRCYHTATLLPSGKVLVAGGYESGRPSSAELYDVGLGFDAPGQPQIATFTSPLTNSGCLVLTGSRFRGVSGGSGGNGSQDSSADYPVVQLRRLDNEQTLFLLCINWQTNSFTSAPVTNLPAGWAMATMFVNGTPSTSSLLRLGAAAMPSIRVTNVVRLSGGACQFTFTNLPALGFTVLAATDQTLPLDSWTVLGCATEVSPGRYQFTDSQATNFPQRFYRVRSL